MKRVICAFLLLFPTLQLASAPLSPSDCFGRWKNDIYTFTFTKNYTASIIIAINPQNCFVFNGVFNVERDNLIRVNISEMKSCPRDAAFSKSGFSKASSSHFIFSLDHKGDKRTLIVRPKEIIIDGNNSEGYFDQEMTLRRN